MPEDACESAFLTSFRGLYEFFTTWTSDMASRFDDRTALLRPSEDVNHPLWILGHITWIIDGLLVEVPTGKTFRRTEWDVLFKIGAQRAADDDYPAYGDVREAYEDVRKKVASHLEGLGVEDVMRPCPGHGDWFQTPIDAMLHFLRDADYHLGQMSMLDKLIER